MSKITPNTPPRGDDICIFPDSTAWDWSEMTEDQRAFGDYIRLPVDCEIWTRHVNSDDGLTYEQVVQAIRDELEAIDLGG
jgi:hypothetical protein